MTYIICVMGDGWTQVEVHVVGQKYVRPSKGEYVTVEGDEESDYRKRSRHAQTSQVVSCRVLSSLRDPQIVEVPLRIGYSLSSTIYTSQGTVHTPHKVYQRVSGGRCHSGWWVSPSALTEGRERQSGKWWGSGPKDPSGRFVSWTESRTKPPFALVLVSFTIKLSSVKIFQKLS